MSICVRCVEGSRIIIEKDGTEVVCYDIPDDSEGFDNGNSMKAIELALGLFGYKLGDLWMEDTLIGNFYLDGEERATVDPKTGYYLVPPKTHGTERTNSMVMAHNLMKTGGAWLGAARSFLQRKAINGERLTWGSNAPVIGLTVQDIEQMAAFVAEAAINEHLQRQLRGLDKAQ